MNTPLPFQEFQYALGRHLRQPHSVKRPAGVPVRRAEVYHRLLRNNLEGFLLACFPVTHTLLGARRWPRLVDAFFREARCHTPWFREIPREFLDWLLAAEALPVALPPWLAELAHYEWVELALDVMETATLPAHDPHGDLLENIPVLAPALMNLVYAWPVHRIGPAFRPRKPQAVHLLVFRNLEDRIEFVELNPVSARLVTLLQEGGHSGRDASRQIAAELHHPSPDGLCGHGTGILNQLRLSGAILGSRTT
ncbi:MAG: putative DNA-binding domain-containing protein [Rugosibacter sp.]|nr:putative DNA-binding domain-containing protein [Rugosibacter sp.]